MAVRVAGGPIAVFRTASGGLGAVADVCPHRRLKLSVGTSSATACGASTTGGRYDACGNGESPATPRMTTCTTSYDVREEHGLIWLKTRDSNPVFPAIEATGFFHIGTLEHVLPAPLELAVDNFNEIEHSGTVHDVRVRPGPDGTR